MSGVTTLPPPTLAASSAQMPAARQERLWKQAQDFEAMFLENMLGHVTSGLTGEGPLGANGTGGEIWRDMLTQHYARGIAAGGGIGIAPTIYSELLKMQEARGNA